MPAELKEISTELVAEFNEKWEMNIAQTLNE